ncbi:hypothetical protein [Streptomyces sp. 5-10]|uniref:hypothetical protein n=1 Tax=Streptomyces sp. 5-10 TaxID=878925 RepID=UPI00168A4765|nr:hypothetical protein [Streptomyces sp. 5-10]MBD3004613.1 hypothetical protein [Streptomyces sp. 5-10]
MTGEPDRRHIEGVIFPAGQSLGVPPEHAGNADARDAAAALQAAGHEPALLSGEFDDDDTDTARGTGFRVIPRVGGRVLVYHLIDGRDGGAVSGHKEVLRAYRKSLRVAGWDCDSRIFRCVHAWRVSPLPEGVTAIQNRGGNRVSP